MDAKTALGRLSGQQGIAGRLVRASGGEAIDVWDPGTEERISQIADADSADIDQAVASANSAQRSWRSVNFHRRAELLHEVSRRGMGARPRGAEKLTPEMGKTHKGTFHQTGWAPRPTAYYPAKPPPPNCQHPS